jgi:hypothetical protein
MRSTLVAMLGGAAALALGLSIVPADAAPKKKASAASYSMQQLSSQSRRHVRRTARASTRIIVRRRSYLDPGTEVLPGERKFTDYAIPPGYDPMQVVSGAGNPSGFQNPGYPLPGPHFPWPP